MDLSIGDYRLPGILLFKVDLLLPSKLIDQVIQRLSKQMDPPISLAGQKSA
jgi:hypothetical protein